MWGSKNSLEQKALHQKNANEYKKQLIEEREIGLPTQEGSYDEASRHRALSI
jgi:hypothetical protein